MNLQVLRPSRKVLHSGDIFVWRILRSDFGFGRVVKTDCHEVDEPPNMILIYIYKSRSSAKEPVPELCCDKLLLPPKLINRLPWSRGYFEVIENRPLGAGDVLPVHCFHDKSWVKETYVNEYGIKLQRRTEPCGLFAMSSFRTIDTAISEALGIAPHPDNLPKPRA